MEKPTRGRPTERGSPEQLQSHESRSQSAPQPTSKTNTSKNGGKKKKQAYQKANPEKALHSSPTWIWTYLTVKEVNMMIVNVHPAVICLQKLIRQASNVRDVRNGTAPIAANYQVRSSNYSRMCQQPIGSANHVNRKLLRQ